MTSSLPVHHVQWMYQHPHAAEDADEWVAFSPYDSSILEQKWNESMSDSSKISVKSSTTVLVDQGRYEVDIGFRKAMPLYWDKPAQKVIRGTWFLERNDRKTPMIPLPEDQASILEDAWTKLLQERDESKPPTSKYLIHDYVNLKESAEASSLFETCDFVQADTVAAAWNKYSIVSFHRGQTVATQVNPKDNTTTTLTPAERIAHSKPTATAQPKHLIFIIHGIGEFFCKKSQFQFPGIVACASDIRKLTHDVLSEKFREEVSDNQFVEYIPIEWCDCIRDDEDLLEDVSLKSLQIVRDISKEVLADVLFYMAKQQVILSYIANSLNKLQAKFLEKHPNFDGKISILGHSLGSVIAFDLLEHQRAFLPNSATADEIPTWGKLHFNLDSFFAIGSPIGMFEAVRGKRMGSNSAMPTCEHVLNIYHPMDPVAYRIEPLINQELKNLKPVRIERFEGGDRLHYIINDLGAQIELGKKELVANVNTTFEAISRHFSSFSNLFSGCPTPQEQSEADEGISAPLSPEDGSQLGYGMLNKNMRIDHELQSTPIEHFHQFAAALWAHTSYWQNKDMILFLMKHLLSGEIQKEEQEQK